MSYEVDHAGNLSSREAEVPRLLNTKNFPDALKTAVSNPPYGADDATKARSYNVVFQVLQTVKDPKGVVGTLNNEEADALIKFIYHGLAHDDTNGSPDPLEKQRRTTTCALLLAWHAGLKDSHGLGVLVRATTGYAI